jgi:hypothetical protein
MMAVFVVEQSAMEHLSWVLTAAPFLMMEKMRKRRAIAPRRQHGGEQYAIHGRSFLVVSLTVWGTATRFPTWEAK